MPPVPKVILASPRCTPPWPIRRRLLVAHERRDRRRALERGGRAEHPARVDDGGQRGPVDAERVEHAVVPVAAVAALQRR